MELLFQIHKFGEERHSFVSCVREYIHFMISLNVLNCYHFPQFGSFSLMLIFTGPQV